MDDPPVVELCHKLFAVEKSRQFLLMDLRSYVQWTK